MTASPDEPMQTETPGEEAPPPVTEPDVEGDDGRDFVAPDPVEDA
jgi:hypothetical protein